ncbi:GNAT family N-acetyltransferase [Amycolatopsis azurea]|uniref:GNAT family N-acetyltransferase n=1 Tax=Amycolatopsis azurea TaxID=36819 RepID=UPI003818A3C9
MLRIQWTDPRGGSAAWHDDYVRILSAAGMSAYPDDLGSDSDESTVFAYDGDDPVGIAQGRVVRNGFEACFGHFEFLPRPQAMLDKLAVLPGVQGHGVGRLLIREFAARMLLNECATHVALWVDQATPWEGRVKFFESCGFSSLHEGSDRGEELPPFGAEIASLVESNARS